MSVDTGSRGRSQRRTFAFVQARCNSSRLPRKILKPLYSGKEGSDVCSLELIQMRLSQCLEVDEVVFLTSTTCDDDPVADLCDVKDMKFFRGSEKNVLSRFHHAAKLMCQPGDLVVRISGDCPLIDPEICDTMVGMMKKEIDSKKDAARSYLRPARGVLSSSTEGFPDGFDVEVFAFELLEEAFKNATTPFEKEHVTPYMAKKQGQVVWEYQYPVDTTSGQTEYPLPMLDYLHCSLDDRHDYEFLKSVFASDACKDRVLEFRHDEVLKFIGVNASALGVSVKDGSRRSEQQLLDTRNDLNSETTASSRICTKDHTLGLGQQLYVEAKKMIPGGVQLLSKRPEMTLPDQWPAYYQKAEGFEITTLDGEKMKEFSFSGVGACILGYADEDVNRAVIQSVNRGNMCSLNSPNEVKLSKLLIKLHQPWAEMCRYTRSAGDACVVAVRIGRAASKRDKLAFCGYHGWGDWYLSANLNNGKEGLGEHLLAGLSTNGVPKVLENTAFPFKYNRFDELEKIVDEHRGELGTVIMETERSFPPEDNFLEKVRALCDKEDIVLIFDEVSSGFRLHPGGWHMKYGVYPDMAVFGKGMSNGYPFAAVIGKKKVMEAAQETFISSTYYTEDVGFSAALAAVTKFVELGVHNHIYEVGTFFHEQIKAKGEKTNLKITTSGLPCFAAFGFDYANAAAVRTLFVQMMLDRAILAKTAFYPSYAHKKDDVKWYMDEHVEPVFAALKEHIDQDTVEKALRGPVAHSGFQRLS